VTAAVEDADADRAPELADVRIPENPGRGRPSKAYRRALEQFAEDLRRVNDRTGFDMSARGWAYALENAGVITKNQFDYAERTVNKCREKGYLPLDFTAQDDARAFKHTPTGPAPSADEYLKTNLEAILDGYGIDPSFWEPEEYFIQVLVEKVDLREVFAPVCAEYNIPIATSKGWSSMNQRGYLAGRFYKWAKRGKRPVLLYCGDFDPVGKLISDRLRENLADLEDAQIPIPGTNEYVVEWTPDTNGLIIDRFGLNREFIDAHDLSWIENLETSGGKDLADPSHDHHGHDHVQEWLDTHGARKVEANALVTDPAAGRRLFRDTVEKYLGETPGDRRAAVKADRRKQIKTRLSDLGVRRTLEAAVDTLQGDSDE
jgi:hypothetical protein